MGYLLSLLDDKVTVVGIDEHTALIVDPERESCSVVGRGGVTLVRAGLEEIHPSRSTFPLTELGNVRWPPAEEGIPGDIWREVVEHQLEKTEEGALPQAVASVVKLRAAARHRQDWDCADALRERLATLGYRVVDTPAGPQLERLQHSQ
jgi:hypothetical protein